MPEWIFSILSSVTQLSEGLGGLGNPVGPLVLILMSSVPSAGPGLSFSPFGGGGEFD